MIVYAVLTILPDYRMSLYDLCMIVYVFRMRLCVGRMRVSVLRVCYICVSYVLYAVFVCFLSVVRMSVYVYFV